MVYATVVPRRFILESGRVVTLEAWEVEEKLTRSTLFMLWAPDVEKVYKYLVQEQGFEPAIPSTPKGEKYGLRRVLDQVWELHLRLYSNGFIEAEVEVRRDFLEHLQPRRLNVVYEAYEYYRGVYDKLHIWYTPEKEWITRIIDHFNVKLRDPETLTPWKPIVLGIVTTGLFIYALSRLTRGEHNG